MAITTLPSSQKIPGTFFEFDTESSARGLAPITERICLVGAKTSAGTLAVNTPTRILSVDESDALAGVGSEVALMARAAIDEANRQGKSPEIYICVVAEPGGGTAAVKAFTVTGAPTEAGDIVFSVAGVVMRASVASGDSVTTMAAAMKTEGDANNKLLPATGNSSLGVYTLTAREKGVNGSDMDLTVISAPAGVTVTPSVTTPGASEYDITSALDTLVDRHYNAIVCSGHTAAILDDLEDHLDAMLAPDTKSWAIAYVGETGALSVAQALANGGGANTGNRRDVVTVACEASPDLPGTIAARTAIAIHGTEDTALHHNNVTLNVSAPPAASVFTSAELNAGIADGVTCLAPNEAGEVRIVKAVTGQVLDGSGNPFFAVSDVSTVRTLYYAAKQIDIALERFMLIPKNKKLTAGTKNRARDTIYDVLVQMEGAELVQNVDAHKGEIAVDTHPTLTTRLEASIPLAVIVPAHQISGKLVLLTD